MKAALFPRDVPTHRPEDESSAGWHFQTSSVIRVLHLENTNKEIKKKKKKALSVQPIMEICERRAVCSVKLQVVKMPSTHPVISPAVK